MPPLGLRNVISAPMTTPIATAKPRIFVMITEPVSVAVTSALTSCVTIINTTSPMATEIKPLVIFSFSPYLCALD